MSEEILGDRGKALVDEFFRKDDAEKIGKYKDELAAQKSREALSDASCVTDEKVLEKLVSIGLGADTVTALALVPLVYVAWADGKIQDNERKAIMEAAEAKGINPGSPGAALLEDWLSGNEPKGLFPAWKSYIENLGTMVEPDQFRVLRDQVVGFARSVAEAAGGFLGIRSVARSEEDALAKIEAAFTQK